MNDPLALALRFGGDLEGVDIAAEDIAGLDYEDREGDDDDGGDGGGGGGGGGEEDGGGNDAGGSRQTAEERRAAAEAERDRVTFYRIVVERVRAEQRVGDGA